MAKVKIYRYSTLDTNIVAPRTADRWGTREAIKRLEKVADIIEDSAIEVDASVLNSDGFTPQGFDPTK